MTNSRLLSKGQLNSRYYSQWTIETTKYGVVEYIATAEKAYAYTSISTHVFEPSDKRQHFTLQRYIPLDETNPGKSIDTFMKIVMLE